MTVKFWLGAIAMTLVAGTAGTASANEISASAGFNLSPEGGVTNVIFSTAVSERNAVSFATSNSGGISTYAIATDNDSLITIPSLPTEGGQAISTEGGGIVSIIVPPVADIYIGPEAIFEEQAEDQSGDQQSLYSEEL